MDFLYLCPPIKCDTNCALSFVKVLIVRRQPTEPYPCETLQCSWESSAHEVHPLLYHLHLYNHVWWCRICDGWMVGVLSARGIAAFWSFLVSPFGTGTLLLLSMIVGSCVPLAQLFFQVVVLLSKAFYSRGESLYLSFECSSAWFISLVVVGCH